MSASPVTAVTTVDRLRQVIAETIQIDAQALQTAIGRLVVATSAEHPSAPAYALSVHDAAAGVTVLLADRIPAGQEAQALAAEIVRHHGHATALAVLGDSSDELLGTDGKVSNRIERSNYDPIGIEVSGVFAPKYDRHPKAKGMVFTVVGRSASSAQPGHYLIRLETGEELPAWPEEIESALSKLNMSNYTDPNEFLLSEYGKYAENVAEGDPMAFDDWLAGSDLPEIVKARELAKLQERNQQGNVVNYSEPNSGELKRRGVALLSSFMTKSSLEQDVLASYEKQKHLKELGESLLSCMENAEGYPNAKFNGLAESVARCFVLYEENPDVYARIVRGVCSVDLDVFLDTFQGLLLLNTLQQGLADDHDYSFNVATGTIERASELTAGNGLYPALLRQILEFTQLEVQGKVESAAVVERLKTRELSGASLATAARMAERSTGAISIDAIMQRDAISIINTTKGWAAVDGAQSAQSGYEGQNFDPAYMIDVDYCVFGASPEEAVLRNLCVRKLGNYVELPIEQPELAGSVTISDEDRIIALQIACQAERDAVERAERSGNGAAVLINRQRLQVAEDRLSAAKSRQTPGNVESAKVTPVLQEADSNPFVTSRTVHFAEVSYWWADGKVHDSDYQIKVNDALNKAAETAAKKHDVMRDIGYCCQWEGLQFVGDTLTQVVAAATDVSRVLARFKGVKPLPFNVPEMGASRDDSPSPSM